jgi:hypothetical protein
VQHPFWGDVSYPLPVRSTAPLRRSRALVAACPRIACLGSFSTFEPIGDGQGAVVYGTCNISRQRRSAHCGHHRPRHRDSQPQVAGARLAALRPLGGPGLSAHPDARLNRAPNGRQAASEGCFHSPSEHRWTGPALGDTGRGCTSRNCP